MFEEKLNAPWSFTFDDLLLVPNESHIEPSHADVSTIFSRNIKLNIPIASAAMDTVTETDLAVAMAREGGIGVIHRNMTREQQEFMVTEVKRADELVIHEVVSVSPNQTIQEVWEIMVEEEVGGVPVEEDRLVGIVSKRDIRPILTAKSDKPIREVMTRDLVTAPLDITVKEAMELMYDNKVERLPVVDGEGRLAGIITMQDILERRLHPNAAHDEEGKLVVAAAVGPFDLERAIALDKAGADAIVVDCAHAHNMNVVKSAKKIKENVSADVIVGNIATKEAALALVDYVDGLKVGVGPGSICTTRVVAGVGVPQLSAVAGVASVALKHGVPVIADGGIRYSGDIAKAIAIGADTVMLGNLLAGTYEAPGRTIIIKGRRYKQYRGMGSLGAMTGGHSSDRYFQQNVGTSKFVPEGVESAIPERGSVSDMLYQLLGGLRSSMGYVGAININEMQERARFVRITSAGERESHPHDVFITDEAPNYPLGDGL